MNMEPMNLGSPPSSPASPTTNPNYLPAFLMGGNQPTSPNPMTSPGRNKTPVFNKQNPAFNNQSNNNPTNLRQKLFNQSVDGFAEKSMFSPPAEKGGPPRNGLFDTIEKPKSPISNSTMTNYNNEPLPFTPNASFSRIGNDTMNYSCNLSETRSPFQNTTHMRNDQIDTLWVTIFGFIPSSTSLVLAQLSNCGTIIDKKYPTQGNWLHIKFNSLHEVIKALLLNGKCVSNNIMIGVIPYYNKQDKENLETSSVYMSPNNRARSLRRSYVPHQNSNTVITPQNMPQRSTGIVTKAMEYVFGW